jgi:uncharacterized protein
MVDMRYNELEKIKEDLKKKMVFLVGPRQTGKTWLSKELMKDNSVYLNYDSIKDKEIIKNMGWLPNAELIILDELHKMPDWKNFLKGVYDTRNKNQSFLVTGSARLDVYRNSGDSMSGRFFTHRLLPFTPRDLVNTPYEKDLERLMKRGGFPEPFLAETDIDASRWRQEYINGLVSEDVFTIDTVENLRSLQLVLRLLQSRVGSPISYTSIAEDVNISPNTVKKYIGLFEALFIVFRVSPFSNNIARSIKKEPKIYFFDLGMVAEDTGMKFENLVALSLLAHTIRKQDYEGRTIDLAYIKNKEGKEVDFLLVENESPVELIEVKFSDSKISPMLKYFSEKYSIPGKQIVYHLNTEYQSNTIQVLKAEKYLSGL